MHHRAGERAVGARTHAYEKIRLPGGGVAVGIHHDDARATLPARRQGMGHDIDLRGGGVGSPEHHHVGLGHLPWIDPSQPASAGDEAVRGDCAANGGVLAGIALGVAQPVDAVALQQSHGACVVVGPYGPGSQALLGLEEAFGDEIQGFLPADALEMSATFAANAPHGMEEPLRVMNAFRVARHLGADDAHRVRVFLGAAHLADGVVVVYFDFEGAGGRAVVGTGGVSDVGLCGHGRGFSSGWDE